MKLHTLLFALAWVGSAQIPAGADNAKIIGSGRPNGILLDDAAGEFTGDWVSSSKQAALVGKGYSHDNNRDQGKKSARFTP